MSARQSREVRITAVQSESFADRSDQVAVEEPLEIRLSLAHHPEIAPVAVAITMRTPGQDGELALGFLWSEGVLHSADQIAAIKQHGPIQPGGFRNIVDVALSGDELPVLDNTARRFYTTSSCGICGKASLEAIESVQPFVLVPGVPQWSPGTIYRMPDALRAAQETFERTGGLHAAGLFDAHGNLITLREDVGRHNAVDKLIGNAIASRSLPLSQSLLFVSGRASFELVQKAVMAGIPALAAVGAPSSLAVSLAREANLTLLGFVRGERFNIYAGDERIAR